MDNLIEFSHPILQDVDEMRVITSDFVTQNELNDDNVELVFPLFEKGKNNDFCIDKFESHKNELFEMN